MVVRTNHRYSGLVNTRIPIDGKVPRSLGASKSHSLLAFHLNPGIVSLCLKLPLDIRISSQLILGLSIGVPVA